MSDAPAIAEPKMDLDKPLTIDGLLVWLGKPVNESQRQWAKRNARKGVFPAFKMGKEWRFHPQTIISQKPKKK